MMTTMMKPASALAAAILLATTASMAAADSSDFERALASDYNALSAAERQQGDRRGAHTYAQRAMAADAGAPTLPDEAELRSPFLAEKYRAELSQARTRLVAALDATGRTDAPADAARAQASYDCWVEQASEDLQPAHIGACRDAFLTAMTTVDEAARQVAVADPPIEAPAPEPAPMAAVPERFLVFFDFDRAVVTGNILDVLKDVEATASTSPFERIVTTGHADRAGNVAYNLALSQRRADAVKAALADAGVEGSVIETAAYGEEKPLVATADGVREAQNRRVEIRVER